MSDLIKSEATKIAYASQADEKISQATISEDLEETAKNLSLILTQLSFVLEEGNNL